MVSYKPLWRYLVEHDISKAECRKRADIKPNTWTRINKGEEVSVAVLNKICAAFNISYGDIIEYVSVEKAEEK